MKKIDEALPLLKSIAEVIGEMFGDKCEVVIHDLTNIDESIAYIINGHVTNRTIGDTLTDLGLKKFKERPQQDKFINYQTKTKEGKILRSSSIFIRDEEGNPIGSVCINFDISELIIVSHALVKMTNLNIEEHADNEHFTTNVNDLLDHLLDETVRIIGKPVSLMQKEDKIKAIKYLNERGAFLIKKAGDRVARYFNISKYTVYNYIDETKMQGN